MRSLASALTLTLLGGLLGGGAHAQGAADEFVGVPQDGGVGFQPAATGLARDLFWLDGFVSIIMFAVVAVVFGLLIWVMVRYNRVRNPDPASFTHNSPVEIAWTIVPILILVGIGAFSLPVLFEQQEIPEGDVRIKVTGYQWYWGYEYEDEGIAFEQFMLAPDELEEAGYAPQHYRLATNDPIVVPTGATVVMGVTGADVIHSWTIPAFGVKQDAIPGRLAELWFEAEREGIYFGQCSELCGKDHAYMPITVQVVSPEAYQDWLVEMGGASVTEAAAEEDEGAAEGAAASAETEAEAQEAAQAAPDTAEAPEEAAEQEAVDQAEGSSDAESEEDEPEAVEGEGDPSEAQPDDAGAEDAPAE